MISGARSDLKDKLFDKYVWIAFAMTTIAESMHIAVNMLYDSNRKEFLFISLLKQLNSYDGKTIVLYLFLISPYIVIYYILSLMIVDNKKSKFLLFILSLIKLILVFGVFYELSDCYFYKLNCPFKFFTGSSIIDLFYTLFLWGAICILLIIFLLSKILSRHNSQ